MTIEPDIAALPVVDHAAAGQYEVRLGDHLAVLSYFARDEEIVLVHTEVPPAIERRGIAAKLTEFALEDARKRGLTVIPRCPYVVRYLYRHPEFGIVPETR